MQNKLRIIQGQISDIESVMLGDLLDVLFGRFEAIAESHRAVHEVIYRITEAEGMSDSKSLLAGFRGLWELYQSEVHHLSMVQLRPLVARTNAMFRFALLCMTILQQRVVQHTGQGIIKNMKTSLGIDETKQRLAIAFTAVNRY